jgi:hypothetical protein
MTSFLTFGGRVACIQCNAQSKRIKLQCRAPAIKDKTKFSLHPPPVSQQPPSQHPTLGAHPDKSEWFHCTRIQSIVDERLGIISVTTNRIAVFARFGKLLALSIFVIFNLERPL